MNRVDRTIQEQQGIVADLRARLREAETKLADLESARRIAQTAAKAERSRRRRAKLTDAQRRLLTCMVYGADVSERELYPSGTGYVWRGHEYVSPQTVETLTEFGYVTKMIGPLPSFHWTRPVIATEHAREIARAEMVDRIARWGRGVLVNWPYAWVDFPELVE